MRTLFQLHKQKEMDEGRTISNGEVAKGAGIGRQTYNYLRRGEFCPGARSTEPYIKRKLASYFGVEVEDIEWNKR